MKIIVTGASGHIGSNLCRELLNRGHAVKAQYQTERGPLRDLELESVSGDIRDAGFVGDLVRGAEAVFHLAARISIGGDSDGSLRETNVDGTRNVVDACLRSGVRRLVHFSSIHSFCQQPSLAPLDESRDHVDDTAFAYDRSKAEGERIVRSAARLGLDAVILNPTAVVGPADFRPSRMGRVLIALASGRMPALVDGGFDWVDVRDVVDAAVSALALGESGRCYLLSGRWHSMRAVAAAVDHATGTNRRRLLLPLRIARGAAPVVALAARLAGSPPVFTRESLAIVADGNRKVSHARAAAELGFSARPFDRTVADTIAWFKRHGYM